MINFALPILKGKFSSNAWFGKLRASTPQYPKYPFNGYMVVLREERLLVGAPWTSNWVQSSVITKMLGLVFLENVHSRLARTSFPSTYSKSTNLSYDPNFGGPKKLKHKMQN
jgi:hypothetical protein